MAVSAISSSPQTSEYTLVPVLPSENATTAREAGQTKDGAHATMFGDGDNPSFWDLVDVVNPLQHIPVVSAIYRHFTDDKIGVAADMAGGLLYGGPLGLLASAARNLLIEATGEDVQEEIASAVFGPKDSAGGVADDPSLAEDRLDPESGYQTEELAEDDAPEKPPVQLAAQQAAPAKPQMPQPLMPQPAAAPAQEAAAVATQPPPPPKAAPREQVSAGPAVPAGGAIAFNAQGGVEAPPPSAPAPAADQAAAPMALGQRLMPVPNRMAPTSGKSPAAVSVPLSTNSARSYAPITGRAPGAPPPFTAQGVVAAQEAKPPAAAPAAPQTDAAAPAAPQTAGAGQSYPQPIPTAPAQSTAQAVTGQNWFNAAMMQGLEKYEKTGRPVPAGQTLQ